MESTMFLRVCWGGVLPLLLQVTSEVVHIHILTLVSIKIKECARCSNKKIDR